MVEGDLKDGWDSPGTGEEAVGKYSRWRDQQVQSMRCEETWAFQGLIEDWIGVGDEPGARWSPERDELERRQKFMGQGFSSPQHKEKFRKGFEVRRAHSQNCY